MELRDGLRPAVGDRSVFGRVIGVGGEVFGVFGEAEPPLFDYFGR
ncbi:hypothetical protein [Nostoc sp.]